MTTIRLKTETVRLFLGGNAFNGCHEIRSISCHNATPSKVVVEAQIPAVSNRHGIYTINVMLENDGSTIHRASCSCPVGHFCKHINKVLHRIIDSQNSPLPIANPPVSQQQTQRRRRADMMDHASVYIALACQSELDSGSDYRRSELAKDNVDQEILGVFFSKRQANKCAKERAYAEGYYDSDEDDDNEDKDDDDDDNDDDDDDEELFAYDESDNGNYDGHMFSKVWVEQRVIEDASVAFQR